MPFRTGGLNNSGWTCMRLHTQKDNLIPVTVATDRPYLCDGLVVSGCPLSFVSRASFRLFFGALNVNWVVKLYLSKHSVLEKNYRVHVTRRGQKLVSETLNNCQQRGTKPLSKCRCLCDGGGGGSDVTVASPSQSMNTTMESKHVPIRSGVKKKKYFRL